MKIQKRQKKIMKKAAKKSVKPAKETLRNKIEYWAWWYWQFAKEVAEVCTDQFLLTTFILSSGLSLFCFWVTFLAFYVENNWGG